MRSEVTIPLAELQDIGERFAPEVLRSFFISHGVGRRDSTPETGQELDLEIPREISSQRLKKIKRIMLVTVPAFLVCSIAAAIAFSAQSETWDNIHDPVLQFDTVACALPKTTASVLAIYAIASSVVGELVASYFTRFKGHWFVSTLGFFSGLCSRSLFVATCLSIVILLKAAPKLSIIAIAPLFAGIGYLGILLPVRTLVAIAFSDNFAITHSPFSLFHTVPASALQSVNLAAVRSSSTIPADLERLAACPSNHLDLRRIAHASIVFDWKFLFSKLLKNFIPFSIQTDVLLAASVKSYFAILAYHLLMLPIYAFFLYDIGPNPVIAISGGLSVASAVLTFVIDVIPINRRTISDHLVDS